MRELRVSGSGDGCNLELMPEALAIDALPLLKGEDGVIRVAGTRVPLDTIVEAFLDGATAEGISESYPTVSLADTYQIIGYYLRHRAELDRYLSDRNEQRREIRALNESRWPSAGIRERLLARRK